MTGSSGLIGSEMASYYCDAGYDVWGIDNDLRKYFFGNEASTERNKNYLIEKYKKFSHHSIDIRNKDQLNKLFQKAGKNLVLILHAAAQPSHDWAAREPLTDFGVNATGTLNMLECFKEFCPDAVFIFTSTNKVYGDNPNNLPFQENKTRYDLPKNHELYNGISENFPIDNCTHSIFGASKLAADILVQEYGRYFGLKTGTFRGGCLTGGRHTGTMMHGFLSYLIKCALIKREYTIIGYKGKQVRDNIHSSDLIAAFDYFFKNPSSGEAFNIGGTRLSNCSILEAIQEIEAKSKNKMDIRFDNENRIGDHQWWISDSSKFSKRYPKWQIKYDTISIIEEIYETQKYLLESI